MPPLPQAGAGCTERSGEKAASWLGEQKGCSEEWDKEKSGQLGLKDRNCGYLGEDKGSGKLGTPVFPQGL